MSAKPGFGLVIALAVAIGVAAGAIAAVIVATRGSSDPTKAPAVVTDTPAVIDASVVVVVATPPVDAAASDASREAPPRRLVTRKVAPPVAQPDTPIDAGTPLSPAEIAKQAHDLAEAGTIAASEHKNDIALVDYNRAYSLAPTAINALRLAKFHYAVGNYQVGLKYAKRAVAGLAELNDNGKFDAKRTLVWIQGELSARGLPID